MLSNSFLKPLFSRIQTGLSRPPSTLRTSGVLFSLTGLKPNRSSEREVQLSRTSEPELTLISGPGSPGLARSPVEGSSDQ